MDAELPVPPFPGLRVMTDTSPAQWLVERLTPSQGRAGRVAAVTPDEFPAYGRLLHPARMTRPGGQDRVRWSKIAADRGVSLDPAVRFRELTSWGKGPNPPQPYSAPLRGSLDEEQCAALAEVLAGFTSQPETIWYLLWEGYGWPELPPPGEGPPRVHLEHEDCLLFTGPINASDNFRFEEWFQSPTMWWPDDRTWFVSTPVDAFSTYIGGSEPCLNALMNDTVLEVLPAQIDQAIDPSPYPGQ